MRWILMTMFIAMVGGLAAPALAQEGSLLQFSRRGWGLGSSSEIQEAEGLNVQLEVIQRDTILGEPKIYVRGRFCNSGHQPWTGGQRLSERSLRTTHASLHVPANGCRTWTEWMPASVQTIYVFLRRGQ